MVPTRFNVEPHERSSAFNFHCFSPPEYFPLGTWAPRFTEASPQRRAVDPGILA